MGFYIRKSVSAGPFRFNFSKGGVGVSVGVKGLRIGTGPRGHYIHAGAGGLYYRASLRSAGKPPSARAPIQSREPAAQRQDDVAMIEIDSGDVMLMRDETFGEMLDEINAKARQIRMAAVLCWIGIAVGMLSGLATGAGGLLLGALALPGWAIGSWFDSYRRSTVLFYDLEGDADGAYNQLASGFEGLRSCAGKWHIEAGGAITNLTAWKRNAGASHLVKKKPTDLSFALPAVIKSNVTPPALRVGRQTMYFLPDVVLIEDGRRIGAVGYDELELRWQDSRFIEDGPVPRDARVVDHTWKHPNKNGGPDRRFRDNRQIPICLYEVLHFQSRSGVNELVEFSQTGKASAFADGCMRLANLPTERTLKTPASTEAVAAQDAPPSTQDPPTPRKWLRIAGYVSLAIVVGLPLLGAFSLIKPHIPAAAHDASPLESGKRPAEPGFEMLNMDTVSAAPTSGSGAAASVVKEASDGSHALVSPSSSGPPTSPPATAISPLPKVDTPSLGQPANTSSTRYGVNLREGPGKSFRILKTLPSSTVVSVIEQKRSWTHIRTESGMTGWITSDAISDRRQD